MCIHFLAPSVYIHMYRWCQKCILIRGCQKKCIHIRGRQKMYTHFKRCYLCKICIHILAPSVYTHTHTHIYIYMCTECAKNVYTSEGAKKCIHILRDVIYVKCVYIFLALSVYIHTYIYIYIQRVPKKCIHIRGCQKMYTHFKRYYLCKMCIHFLGTLCTHIYIYICSSKNIYITSSIALRHRVL